MLIRKFLKVGLLLMGLSGCVGTEYRVPEVSASNVAKVRSELQKEAVAVQLERRGRLYDLAWPVIANNKDLCAKERPSIGLVLANAELAATYVGGLEKHHLEALGYSDKIEVLRAIAGSPAEKSGIQNGWILTSLNGEEIKHEAPSKISKEIISILKNDDEIDLGFENESGDSYSVSVQSARVCDVAVKLSTSSELNALATPSTIIFHAGLLSRLSDDGAQYVLSHELAHVSLKHPRKVVQNSLTSGGAILAPVLYSGGYLIDKTLKLFGQDSVQSYALSGLALAVPYSELFESEADYLGLYMFARAGGDLNGAEEAFRLFAQENPSSTWISYTHPMTPERIARLRAALKEIERGLGKGEELMPKRVH